MTGKLDNAVPLADAARRLGLSYATVHKRLQRGNLTGIKRGGRWYVLMDEFDTPPDSTSTEPDTPLNQLRQNLNTKLDGIQTEQDTSTAAFIARLEADIDFLQAEVVRKDHIIAGLVERLPQLPSQTEPVPQHAAPAPKSFWKRLFVWDFPIP